MQHIIATLTGNCDDEKKLLGSMLETCHTSGLSVIKTMDHAFYPQGYTAIILLAESHFSIHTFPENNMLKLDIFSCDPNIQLDTVVSRFTESAEMIVSDFKTLER